MEEYRNGIILVCVSIYMALCVGVGIWAMRKTKSTKDFFMAGRNLGVFVTGLALFSSTLSGFGFVGGPGLVYRMGMSSVWMIVCSSIGFCLSSYLLSKRLRMYAEVTDSVSLPDAVAARYNSELSRFLTALAIILGVIGYLGTQILAMAVVLQGILNNIEWIPEVSQATAMIVSCAVLVFYCVTGGIIASVYTDVVQGSVMVVAAVLVFFAALGAVDGGMGGVVATLYANDAESIGPWGTIGMMGALSWYFVFALGGAGQPHIITKMMMTRTVKQARDILPVSAIGYTVSALLWISIGLVIRALVVQGSLDPLVKADDAAATFLQSYAHPLLAGVVFAGLFAAIMSTADGFLNIGVAAIVHDIPKAIRNSMTDELRRTKIMAAILNNGVADFVRDFIGGLSEKAKSELLWARIMTVILAAGAAIFVSRSGESMVALLGAFGWGTFAAAIVPTVAIGFSWKRATPLAVNMAMGVSLTMIFAMQLSGFVMPYGIDKGATALIVSLTIFFVISLSSKKPKIDPYIERIMDL